MRYLFRFEILYRNYRNVMENGTREIRKKYTLFILLFKQVILFEFVLKFLVEIIENDMASNSFRKFVLKFFIEIIERRENGMASNSFRKFVLKFFIEIFH